MLVFGTGPEVIKMCPIVLGLLLGPKYVPLRKEFEGLKVKP